MSKIKDKFTHGFKKNRVDVNEPVKTNVSDDDPLRYYEPPIPVEELLAESARLAAEKASEIITNSPDAILASLTFI